MDMGQARVWPQAAASVDMGRVVVTNSGNAGTSSPWFLVPGISVLGTGTCRHSVCFGATYGRCPTGLLSGICRPALVSRMQPTAKGTLATVCSCASGWS